MSTSPTQPGEPATPQAAPAPPQAPAEVLIVSHSMLFYWWPVWALGYLLALLTYINDSRMAIVPPHTTGYKNVKIEFQPQGEAPKLMPNRDVFVEPESKHKPAPEAGSEQVDVRLFHIHSSKNPGVVFCIVILLVITITTLPLRGVWSIVVILVVVSLTIIFVLLGVWEYIFTSFNSLAIFINAGGYLFLSTMLFIIWLAAFLFIDRQTYISVTPGQLKVCLEVGGGETAYDTMGMTIQKHRDDMFRHWILGLGSGDLTIRTSGANNHEFNMPNVLFVGAKLKLIEAMLRDKPVVRG